MSTIAIYGPTYAYPGAADLTNSVDTQREYASGGIETRWRHDTVLNRAFDDVYAKWGVRVYDEMRNNPTVAACFESVRKGAVRGQLQISACMSEDLSSAPEKPETESKPGEAKVEVEKTPEQKQHEADVEEAELARDLCRWLVDRMDRTMESLALEIAEGAIYGCIMPEVVWEYADHDGEELLTIAAIKPKPRESWDYVVDPYMNVLGLYVEAVDEDGVPIQALLPISKFAPFVWMPRNCDPRGTSMFRPAYDPWLSQNKTRPQRFQFNQRFSQPRMIVKAALGAATPSDPIEGTVQTGQVKSRVEVLAELLEAFEVGTWMIIGIDEEFEYLEPTSKGDNFDASMQSDSREICLALLCNTRSILEAQHGSKADSQTSQDVSDIVTAALSAALCQWVMDQVFYPFLLANKGPEFADKYTPVASFGSSEVQDWAKMAQAAATLKSSGFLTQSQQRFVSVEILGLPAPSFDELEQQQEMQMMAKQGLQAAAKGGEEDGGKPGGNDKP